MNRFLNIKPSLLSTNVGFYGQSEGLGTDYGSSWVRELIWALLPGEELFAAAAAADPHGNFGARSKIGFQNATGSSSGPCKVPELRIELAVPVFHAEGR